MTATARAVDLSNVKEGGNFRPRRKPEGDYLAKIVKVDDHQPNDKSKPMGWVYTIQVDGDARSTYPYYVNPEVKQAWKIRTICAAVGINVKLARIKFDPNKLVGKAVGVALADDEYEGRPKSVIDDLFPASEVGNANEDVTEEEVDTDEVEGDYDDDEPDEVEEEPEPEPVKPTRRVARKKPAPEPEPEPEDEYEDDEEEAEEEPPPPPVRKRRTTAPPTKAVAPARKRAAAPVVEDDDDLDDLDTDDLD
jgi:hypothetical protein